MTTIRISHQKQYTCIANKAIRDNKLSYKARGIHHLLLSYPDNWVVNTTHLVNGSDLDGRDAVRSGLQELEQLGYLIRNRARTEKGQFGSTTYTVYEFPLPLSDSPQPENPQTENPQTENPQPENPTDGKSAAGKSNTILNTDIRSTDNNEVLKHEVTISPPTPSQEVGIRNSEFGSLKQPQVVDNATTSVDTGDSIQLSDNSSLSTNDNRLSEKENLPACSTQITRKTTDGIFGAKRSTLAIQKEKAKQEAIAGGYFESFEQRQSFFGELQGFLKAINPTWEPGKVRGTAIVQTNRLNAGTPNAEDEDVFQMFVRGELKKYQNMEYDHQQTLVEQAEQKRLAKRALYDKYNDPTKVRSKLLIRG